MSVSLSRGLYDPKWTFSLCLRSNRNDKDECTDWEVVSCDRLFSPAVTSKYDTFYNVGLHQRKSTFPSHPVSTALPSGCWKDQTFNHYPAKLLHFHKMLLISPKFWYNLFKNRKTTNQPPVNKWVSCVLYHAISLANSALQGTPITIFSGFHREQTQHAQTQKHHFMH